MKKNYRKFAQMIALSLAPTLFAALPVKAQQIDEIIVTARKREESLQNVPVVETAIPQSQLERTGTLDLKDIATLVPGLSFGDAVLSVGTLVSIRGIGTSALDPGVEAAVSLNIDGLPLSQGLAYASGVFDLSQVEVLKGPQSLFYGKSSPGGVISLRTADPTDTPEVILSGGYEYEAEQKLGEVILSGPVTDTLKLRLASQYSEQAGFYENVAEATPGLGGTDPLSRIGGSTDYIVRGTALWDPTNEFTARVKVNQVHDVTQYAGILQLGLCPDGTSPVPGIGIPFISPKDDCKINRTNALVDLDPAAFPGVINNGRPFIQTTQTYGTIDLTYRPRTDLSLSSTTGYYLVHAEDLYNTQAADAGPFLAITNRFRRREVTEEVRASSDFSGPVNFTAGGFIQRAQFANVAQFLTNQDFHLGLPPVIEDGSQTVDVHTNSVFGQVRYRVVPQVEIAAGARWTDEKRTDTAIDLLSGTPVLVPLAVPEIQSRTMSPEFTVTYQPTDDLTLFGALKRGYKSGSFDVATPASPGENTAFGDEKVDGGELGLKSRWLDRRLVLDLAVYDYHYTGLQVGANVQTANGMTETQTVNAGSAQVHGIEGDMAYRVERIAGLGLHASMNWNHARFSTLNNIPCYGGQTIAAGCDELYSAAANGGAGGFTAQNRSGVPLIRAPAWQTTFGFDYETNVSSNLKLVFASSTEFSSNYLTNLGYLYYQPSFFKTDFSISLKGPNDRWEVGFFGKDLNNALTSGNCSNANTRGGLLGGEITGSTGVGPAGVDDTGCWMDRGRELWLRVTYKPLK